MSEVITRDDAGRFSFSEYRKRGTTRLSDQLLPTGTKVQTLEGEYTCAEPSRLAIDVAGNVYPVAESIFAKSYTPTDAAPTPPAPVARAKFMFVGRKIEYGASQRLTFQPVYDKSLPEDTRFYDATPSGEFTMLCNNPAVNERLDLGTQYYIDVTPTE